MPVLSGPHVPRFVAAGDLSATPYVAMERVEGESLTRHHRSRAGAGRRSRSYRRSARGRGKQRAHPGSHPSRSQAGKLHPASRRDWRCCSTSASRSMPVIPDLLAEGQHFAAGSSPYVSPEQLRNDRSDPRSDFFALGVLLYELATGTAAVRGADYLCRHARQVVARAAAAACHRMRRYRLGCRRVILRCLEPDGGSTLPVGGTSRLRPAASRTRCR